MKKVIGILLIFLFVGSVAYGSVGVRDVAIVCENWLHFNHSNGGISGIHAITYKGLKVGYVVNLSPEGFIIVPDEKYLSPVKFWSRHGKFELRGPIEDIVKGLYDVEVRMTQYTKSSNKLGSLPVAPAWGWLLEERGGLMNSAGELGDNEAAPLITSRWDQVPPYNNKVPVVGGSIYSNGRAPVGCVAVSMAQIMRFYRCPVVGVGTHSYRWNGHTLSADFNHSYDWLSMPDSLDGASQQQIDIVSQTLYEIGVSVNMDYSAHGSGATLIDAMNAFVRYFKYDPGSIYLISALLDFGGDIDAYFEALRDERDAGRAVNLAIYGSSGGHSVVMDGYRIISLFDIVLMKQVHLNLGWGGAYDGYYTLDDIRPAGMDFSDARSSWAIVGIVPTEQQGGSGGGGCTINGNIAEKGINVLVVFVVVFAALFIKRKFLRRKGV